MNRKEFIKIMGAVATAAALDNIGFAEEGAKKNGECDLARVPTGGGD